jgi:hypothetical protein
MGLLQLKFGGVFAGDDALVMVDKAVRQFSSVVLPEPVPPDMTTLQRDLPMISRTPCALRRDRAEIHQLLKVSLSFLNLRMVSVGAVNGQWRGDHVDTEPSSKRASHIGELSSTRRPTWLTIR